ncbi:hypothetical protein ABPG74_015231 [Tetrahymena malaccensis]
MLKIKIYSQQSQKQISEYFQDGNEYDKIKLSIINMCHFNKHLEDLIQLVCQKDYVKQLILSLQNSINMSLDTFYLINKCQSLTQLEINFKNNMHLSIIQNHNLGQCIKQLLHLNSLKFTYNCKYLGSIFEQLNMREAYLNLENLKDFQLILKGKNKECKQIFYQIFDGLRFSKNLQSLLVGLEQKFIVRDSMFFEKLDQEIGDLNQLKSLSLNISWGISVSFRNMQILGIILNKLPQLVKFSICTPLNNQPQSTKFIGIENSILQLQNLKELSLKIIENSQLSIFNLLFSINQIKNLERVELDLYLSTQEQVEFNLNELFIYISQIQSLATLRVYFCYVFELTWQEIIRFLRVIKDLQKLKILQINFNENRDEIANLESDFNDLSELENISKNLEQLYITTYCYDLSRQQHKGVNKFLSLIKNAFNLSELQLNVQTYGDDKKGQVCSNTYFSNILLNFYKLQKFKVCLNQKIEMFSFASGDLFAQLALNPIVDLQFVFQGDIDLSYQFFQEMSGYIQQAKKLECLKILFKDKVIIDDIQIAQLNNSFHQLQNLKHLDLEISLQKISHKNVIKLNENISNLIQLKTLDLKLNQIKFNSSNQIEEFSKSVKFSSSLKIFYLESKFSNPNYEDFKGLFENIQNLIQLDSLSIDLGKLRFKKEGCIHLKNCLSNLKLLSSIMIQAYSFNLLYLVNLFDELLLLKKIELLKEYESNEIIDIQIKKQICFNKQEQLKIEQINNINSISSTNQRFKLNLQINQLFQMDDFECLSWCFQNMRQITILNLVIVNNSLVTGNELFYLFRNLKLFNNLKTLKMKINQQIDQDNFQELTQALKQISMLRSLSLNFNLSNEITFQDNIIIQDFGDLNELETFKFKIKNNNELNQQFDFDFFCEQINKMKNLRKLTINLRLFEIKTKEPYYQLSLNPCKNLLQLKFFVQVIQQQYQTQIYRCLSRFTYLQTLKIFSDLNLNKKMYKLHRLVQINFKKSNYFE